MRIPTERLKQDEFARQQRRNDYRREFDQQQRFAERREQILRQERRLSQLRFQQEYFEHLRQDRIRLEAERDYYYAAPEYRYYRAGRYYETSRYGSDMLRRAVNYGYAEGARAGQADRADGYRFDFDDSPAFQDAAYGYDGYYVDLPEYQYYFREGFRRGYEDGYEGRYQYGSYNNGVFNILGGVLQGLFDPRPF
jgi:hypothetical protein